MLREPAAEGRYLTLFLVAADNGEREPQRGDYRGRHDAGDRGAAPPRTTRRSSEDATKPKAEAGHAADRHVVADADQKPLLAVAEEQPMMDRRR